MGKALDENDAIKALVCTDTERDDEVAKGQNVTAIRVALQRGRVLEWWSGEVQGSLARFSVLAGFIIDLFPTTLYPPPCLQLYTASRPPLHNPTTPPISSQSLFACLVTHSATIHWLCEPAEADNKFAWIRPKTSTRHNGKSTLEEVDLQGAEFWMCQVNTIV